MNRIKKILPKKALFLLIAIFLIPGLCNPSLLLAKEKQNQGLFELQGISLLNTQTRRTSQESPGKFSLEIPDWLKRTSFGVFLESEEHPRVYLETVQPLYQSSDKAKTIFTHDRISIQDEKGTYSAGLGYRQLFFDEQLLAGINTFFDYQDLHQHYRQGAGLELISKVLEARINAYFGLSAKRLVEFKGVCRYEKVVNGGDVELGGPVPYLPWLKIFGGYNRYDFRRSKDLEGWKVRCEIKPLDFFTLNLETFDDNQGKQGYRLDGRIQFVFDTFKHQNPKPSSRSKLVAKKAYQDIDLKDRTLDRVERDFNIKVEEWLKGNIRVQLTWEGNSDLDLHMYLQEDKYGTAQHVYFGDLDVTTPDGVHGYLDADDTPGDRNENIYVDTTPLVAQYGVYANCWSLSGTSEDLTVKVYLNGELKHTYTHTFTASGQNYTISSIVY